MIEYFLDTEGKDRFRVKGGNGEIVATSEPYTSVDHAHRGVRDLYMILLKVLGGSHAENTTDSNVDGGGSSNASESEDTTSPSEDEGPTPLPADFDRHDEVPGDNPAALIEDGDRDSNG